MPKKTIEKFCSKSWGHEKWIVNNDDYCGKILFFAKGLKCSFHYHKLKDETFYIQSGKVIVRYSPGDNIEYSCSDVLEEGDVFHVPRGLRHQIEAILDSHVYEFSTKHFDSDSYRIEVK